MSLVDLQPTNTLNNWYCIRTQRYKENWVGRQLGELCDEVYCPLLRQRRSVRRQLKWVVEPLFPRYLFARFSVAEQFQAVRHTPGVVNVVSSSEDGPIIADETIIRVLRERSVNGYIEVQPAPFFPGDELEVVAGPLQGVRALFQQALKGGERVAVLLDLLSSRVRVELPWAYVQKWSVPPSRQLATA